MLTGSCCGRIFPCQPYTPDSPLGLGARRFIRALFETALWCTTHISPISLTLSFCRIPSILHIAHTHMILLPLLFVLAAISAAIAHGTERSMHPREIASRQLSLVSIVYRTWQRAGHSSHISAACRQSPPRRRTQLCLRDRFLPPQAQTSQARVMGETGRKHGNDRCSRAA